MGLYYRLERKLAKKRRNKWGERKGGWGVREISAAEKEEAKVVAMVEDSAEVMVEEKEVD